jgi:hypothetical protein
MSTVKDMLEARREEQLAASPYDWEPLPAPPPKSKLGTFPLVLSISEKMGLPVGFMATMDEFAELTFAVMGYPARYRDRRKDVRDMIWDLILKGNARDEDRPNLVGTCSVSSATAQEASVRPKRRGCTPRRRSGHKRDKRASKAVRSRRNRSTM